MSIRLTRDEINDLCYRHCELSESLTAEEIDKLIDTAAVAVEAQFDVDDIADSLARVTRAYKAVTGRPA